MEIKDLEILVINLVKKKEKEARDFMCKCNYCLCLGQFSGEVEFKTVYRPVLRITVTVLEKTPTETLIVSERRSSHFLHNWTFGELSATDIEKIEDTYFEKFGYVFSNLKFLPKNQFYKLQLAVNIQCKIACSQKKTGCCYFTFDWEELSPFDCTDFSIKK